MFGLLLIPVFWQRSSRLNYLYSFICPLNTRTLFSLKPHFFCLAVFFPCYIFLCFTYYRFLAQQETFQKTLTILLSLYMYCLWRFHIHKSLFIRARFFWGWWVMSFHQVTVSIQMIVHIELMNRLYSFGESWKC